MTREPLSLPGRVVIFDYGEVITLPPTAADRAVIARLAGVRDPGDTGDADGTGGAREAGGGREAAFWEAYSAHRGALDAGTDGGVRGYWRAIAADIGADWDGARVHELWAADFRAWLSVNPGTVEVIADLAAGGTRLAVLSNAGPDFGSFLRRGPLGDYMERFFVSGELGLIKPDPAIYAHALSELGVAARDAVFVDNREDNVRGASALGIAGHVFTTPAALREFLTSLACPDPRGLPGHPGLPGLSGRAAGSR